eukprot:TRINITY_DN2015_c0_g8_i1.p1 TRINITY_DN2015_c0_g8~~TRINITY_DN2015_c0_g8_i1.p1  ORF type:complete len:303 (-),score=76.61 TRINITY_DN2015_c0_g8_i1:29-937(-)
MNNNNDDDGEGLNFSEDNYFSNLKTDIYGRNLLYHPVILSTQALLHKDLLNFENGTCIVADKQTSGKGRTTNKWSSPKGCLMFSFKCIVSSGRTLPYVQYLISIAILKTISSLTKNIYSRLPIAIKWPNDLYGMNQKIGGVLCQSEMMLESSISYSNSTSYAIAAGIGLNVSNSEPTTCINDILETKTDLLLNNNDPIKLSREDILSSFFNHFEPMLEQLDSEGFSSFYDYYIDNWLHTNQEVLIKEENGMNSKVWVTGLTNNGYLLAVDRDKNRYELHPDGNSFDFFNGLISKKISPGSKV